jgi:hypothetical protein
MTYIAAQPATPLSRSTMAAQPATEMRLPSGNALIPSHSAIAPVAILRVEYRRLVWEVTRDGKFYGHYHERQPALDAAVAAATAIVAQSGRADVVLEHESSAADRSAHDRGVCVPRSVRTTQFR